MEYSQEQRLLIERVIEKLSMGNDDIKKSPSTKVMAINLLTNFDWDINKVLESLK